MDSWVDVRRKARKCHDEALVTSKGDRRAQGLIDAALKNDKLEIRRCDFPKGVLGSMDRSARLVNVANGLDAADELVVIAHEIGHFRLHRDPHMEISARASGLGGDPFETGAGKVEGYSPREQKEVQADSFAGELLCPVHWLRDEFLTRRSGPAAIAKDLGVPVHLVVNQMVRALFLPPITPAAAAVAQPPHELDASQQEAVRWQNGPLLVDAGPGTGKTRTLVRRIQRLLDEGARPSSILALTFSNKAANEMRERLSQMNPDAAIEMWVGTFHKFGLELISKWPAQLKRTTKVRPLDPTGSLALLEANLEKLPLHHFQNLYEPAYELVPVLRVISRCKDELIAPPAYKAAAEAASNAAGTAEEEEAAERMLEIADIYAIYEKLLGDADAVDFGDLVRYAIELAKTHSGVQQYLATFKHILVDEYQDVNRASAELLKAICRPDTDLWVVADQRQSIYRFRGAEPSNVERFEAEFRGARHALANNYRSHAPVVRALERFSATMGGGGMTARWDAVRGAGGGVTMTVAPTLAAEGEAIRDKIEALRTAGIPYSDQAVLARTHLTLARITGVLEQLGVPLLYLGDLFERPEIRNLLSLIGIDAEYGGIGLVRVAALPEYAVPKQDALAALRWARTNKVSVFQALKRAEEIPDLSSSGRDGLLRLGRQLDGLERASPWTLLTTWLFERSDYAHALLARNDPAAQQQLIAIYHLLKVCGEQVVIGDSSRKRFLDRIRRIEALNEDTAYRAVASEAADIDAVRVLTIHGSKGLEFRAVHFPTIATGYMPAGWRGIRILPPPGLSQLAMESTGHEAEEECIFFVGLSRARDFLSLSRAEKYTSRGAGASRFLTSLSSVVRNEHYPGSGRSYGIDLVLAPPATRESYQERELQVYMTCPARYRYETLDGLYGGRDETAYVGFHRCVYVTVGWLEAERQKGTVIGIEAAVAHLHALWEKEGPDHPFAKYYFRTAQAMVRGMAEAIAAETARYDRREWTVPVGRRNILITPDRVLVAADGSVRVQRIRTGRKTKSEPTKPIYALLRLGAAREYPGRPVSVEAFYLATHEVVPMPPRSDDKLLKEYADAIAGIERGDFHAEPDPRLCPNCQCYFICEG